MANTTAQAFAQFMTDISITDYQKTSIVAARKTNATKNLTEAFPATSTLPFTAAYLMGSAAKGTIVRPLNDIDVLALFSNSAGAWNKYRYDSQSFLYRIREAYSGLSVAKVGARGQAIRVFFESGGHVDVAPVFEQGGGVYLLPSGNGGWITTAPFVATEWYKQQNTNLGSNLSPLVRLLKKWNKAHSARLQSFHLETMAANTFDSLSSNRRTALQKFFEWSPSYIDVSDPGGQSGLLSGYLSWTDRESVKASLKAASDRSLRAITAEENGNHEEAKRLWRITLGSSFPN